MCVWWGDYDAGPASSNQKARPESKQGRELCAGLHKEADFVRVTTNPVFQHKHRLTMPGWKDKLPAAPGPGIL